MSGARLPAVREGFAATVLLALGSLTPAYLPPQSPPWGLVRRAHLTGLASGPLGILVGLLGILLLVDAWLRLRSAMATATETDADPPRPWVVLVIWSLPLLLAPPILSQDAYSYAAQGWLVHHHIDPYQHGPGVLPGAFADQVAPVWRDTPAPYGALQVQIAHVLDWATGYRPYAAACANRLPALLGVALVGFLLPRLATRMRVFSDGVAWFALLNPVVVVDFVGGCHNDALMVGLVVLALWLAGCRWAEIGVNDAAGEHLIAAGVRVRSWTRARPPGRRAMIGCWWWIPAEVVAGVAASIKQPALLAAWAIPLVARPWRGWQQREVAVVLARQVIGTALAAGTVLVVSLATGLGLGWTRTLSVPGSALTASPSTVVGFALRWLAAVLHRGAAGHDPMRWAHALGWVLVALVVVVMSVTTAPRRPVAFVARSLLALAVGMPTFHTWYFPWGGVLLPLTRPGRRTQQLAVGGTVGLLCYAAVVLAWRTGHMSLGIACVLACCAVTGRRLRASDRTT